MAAYRLNLAVLSAIALFVGMFLIYQSVTLSVVRRRREIGLLRTLGMTPGQVLLLFLAEGAVSGMVGGAVGLILGVGLARGVLAVMTQNLSSLYMPVVAAGVWVQGGLLLQAWGLAVAATLTAAALPAREAARTQIRAVWYREELEEKLESRVGLITWWGLMCLAGAAACSAWKVSHGPPWPGFMAAFLILLGFALLTPLTARHLGQRLQGLLQRWPAAELGCRYLAGSLSRSAVSIAALACALGMLIAVTVMIGSFRQTVNDWVSRSISGDIFFGPAVFSTAAYDQYLPPEILPELKKDPEIADIYLYRVARLPLKGRDILVIGGSFGVLAKHGGLWFRQGETQAIMQEVGRSGSTGGTLAPPKANPPYPPFSKGGLKSPPFIKGDLGRFSESSKTIETGGSYGKPANGKRKTGGGHFRAPGRGLSFKRGGHLHPAHALGAAGAQDRRGLLRLSHRRPQRLDGHRHLPAFLGGPAPERGAALSQRPRPGGGGQGPLAGRTTAAATTCWPCRTGSCARGFCASSTRPSP